MKCVHTQNRVRSGNGGFIISAPSYQIDLETNEKIIADVSKAAWDYFMGL